MINKYILTNLFKIFICLFTLNIYAAARIEKPNLDEILIESAKQNNASEIETLLQSGANINAQDDEGNTALLIAAKNQNLQLVLNLLKSGADFSIRDQENRLFFNYLQGYNKMFCLFDYCNYKNEEIENFSDRDLLIDFENQLTKFIIDLIEKNKNVSTKFSEVQQFFYLLHGHFQEISLSIYGNYVTTSLLKALNENNIKLFAEITKDNQIFIEYIYSPENMTLLMKACDANKPEFVEILLSNNADQTITDANGKTAIEIARDKGYKNIVKIFEKYSKEVELKTIEEINKELEIDHQKLQEKNKEQELENKESKGEIKENKVSKLPSKKIRNQIICRCGAKIFGKKNYRRHLKLHK